MSDEPDKTAMSDQDSGSAGIPSDIRQKLEMIATRRALERARVARWDRNIVVFLFTMLTLIIILLFQGVGVEIVGSIAVFSLAMVWYVGWRQGKQLYGVFYNEEMAIMQRNAAKTVDETIEEKIQKALRDRWK